MTKLHVLSRFPDCPILVVGDLMLDEFIWGQVSRISPEAPVPVVEIQRRSFTAGGAANTAANVASLRGKAFVVGLVGDDTEGRKVMELLNANGIDTSGIVCDGTRPTITKTRIIAHSQQIARLDQELKSAIHNSLEDELLRRVETALPRVRGVVISDYGKGVITPRFVQSVIQQARHASIPIIVDPKGTEYKKYYGATLIKPNQLEAGKVLNRDLRTDDDVHRAGIELLNMLGSSILITRGASGMSLFEPSANVVSIPAVAREVYDVTGAGDTVAGTIALSLGVGGSLTEACELASLSAAVVVGKVGTATCSWEELANVVSQ